jgi:CheY-like chemotaxis protein/HPt (histidine-containing phosphotransfer) domain-containing protein
MENMTRKTQGPGSEFFHTIAHEISNPLAAISGFLGLALESTSMGEKDDYLRVAMRNASHLQSVVDKLLRGRSNRGTHKAEEIGTEQDSSELPLSDSAAETSTLLKGYKVLVAEDAPDLQILTTYYLERHGAEVTVCGDGLAVTSLASSHHYDCILMDIQMPQKSGFDAAKELRAAGFQGRIVALTAHAFPPEQEKMVKSAFDAILIKPVLEVDIVNAIRSEIVTPVSIYESDPVIREASGMFARSLAEKTVLLTEMLEAQDWAAIVRISHQIKGSSSSFGYISISKAAENLEREARGEKRLDASLSHLKLLQGLAQSLKNASESK